MTAIGVYLGSTPAARTGAAVLAAAALLVAATAGVVWQQRHRAPEPAST